MKTVVYPVADLARAKAVYTPLLGEPHTDAPYYVGYRVGDQEVGLDPNGHASGMTGPVGYWHVDDMDAAIEAMVAGGGSLRSEPREVGGGRRIAVVADADGNAVGLLQD